MSSFEFGSLEAIADAASGGTLTGRERRVMRSHCVKTMRESQLAKAPGARSESSWRYASRKAS
jgi:hypothetical protein